MSLNLFALLRPSDDANEAIAEPSYVQFRTQANRTDLTKVTTVHSPRLSFMVRTATLEQRTVSREEAEANIGAYLLQPIAFIRGDEDVWQYGTVFSYSWSDNSSAGSLEVLTISGERLFVPFTRDNDHELTRVSVPVLATHPALGIRARSLSISDLQDGHSAIENLFNGSPPAKRACRQLRQLRASARFPESVQQLDSIDVVAPDGLHYKVKAQTALDVIFYRSRPSAAKNRRSQLPANWYGDDTGTELSELDEGDARPNWRDDLTTSDFSDVDVHDAQSRRQDSTTIDSPRQREGLGTNSNLHPSARGGGNATNQSQPASPLGPLMSTSLNMIDEAIASSQPNASASIHTSLQAIDHVLETRESLFLEARARVASLLDSISHYAMRRGSQTLTEEDVDILKTARDLGNRVETIYTKREPLTQQALASVTAETESLQRRANRYPLQHSVVPTPLSGHLAGPPLSGPGSPTGYATGLPPPTRTARPTVPAGGRAHSPPDTSNISANGFHSPWSPRPPPAGAQTILRPPPSSRPLPHRSMAEPSSGTVFVGTTPTRSTVSVADDQMIAYSALLSDTLHGKFNDPASLTRYIIFNVPTSFPLSETLLLRCMDFRFSNDSGQLSIMHFSSNSAASSGGNLAAPPEARSLHEVANAIHNLSSFADEIWSRDTTTITSAALRFVNTELLPTRNWPHGMWESLDAVSSLVSWFNDSFRLWYHAVMRSATIVPPASPPSPDNFTGVFSQSHHTFKNMIAGVHVRLIHGKRTKWSDQHSNSAAAGPQPSTRASKRPRRAPTPSDIPLIDGKELCLKYLSRAGCRSQACRRLHPSETPELPKSAKEYIEAEFGGLRRHKS